MTSPYNLKPSGITNAGHPDDTEWFPLASVLDVVRDSLAGKWYWFKNVKCKYVELRIDMRTGECLIKDRLGEIIGMRGLAEQYGEVIEPPALAVETPQPGLCSRCHGRKWVPRTTTHKVNLTTANLVMPCPDCYQQAKPA